MEQQMALFDLLFKINKEGREDLKKELVKYSVKSYIDKKTKQRKEINVMEFTYPQLNSIYNYNKNRFNKNVKGKIQLEDEIIFDIVFDTCTHLQDFKFENEGFLVNYLKRKSYYNCVDEFNKVNKFLGKNNLHIVSYEPLMDKQEWTDEKQGINQFGEFDNFNAKDNMNNPLANDDIEIDIHNINENDYELYIREMMYESVENLLRMNWDCYETRKETELMRSLKQYKEYMTKNQLDKFYKLLNCMENGEKITDEYCNFINVNVKKVLFPTREGNCNKDIQQFINSCNNRFDKFYNEKYNTMKRAS